MAPPIGVPISKAAPITENHMPLLVPTTPRSGDNATKILGLKNTKEPENNP
ncbi:hypothetical protein FOCG_03530 [Fusarium oxysporum f. sp. radicis-lycopersici 26381]|uniref:Uncharacterized protein n=1 Tax=Fusarium oxysporum f. sp. melonis 26406 TaxID=1089452 RepID=W9Z5T6_FUSOX|nr:hypothetical protein FOMG_16401 [Fusarium oxysporum f. sp. melonis 26406]EXL55795.1 hypothetical protein FOCG_03530 [Fusarium oxysporum f. sp. radicis-lycopersici 26381]